MLRRNIFICLVLLPVAGCAAFPEGAHPPKVHNPFPQLSRVAIVNFLNLSDDPTVDGRQFALAYYNELQSIPGFEVVSVRTVEIAMADHKIQLRTPEDARRLAQILGVDVVVVGSVTDFDAYYPPRCGMQVQWIAANPGFHPIPPGYALPWGTTEEEYIPGRLVFEAEMALARAQLETQSPVAGDQMPLPEGVLPPGPKRPNSEQPGAVRQTSAVEPAPRPADDRTHTTDTTGKFAALFPDDPRQTREFFRPSAPQPTPPVLWPSNRPVMEHTRMYNGHDPEFTTALRTYAHFRDDARFAGWQGYLQRTDDFIRFCCHKHIAEMLTARGGAGKTQVVWRWSADR